MTSDSGWATSTTDWLGESSESADSKVDNNETLASSDEIDPIQTTDHLRTTFLRYLKTLHPLQSSDLRSKYWQELEHPGVVVKGPLLEGSAPFRSGQSLEDLIQSGILSPSFRDLRSPFLPLDRPLYLHQQRAIQKVVAEHRNTVVATGTGSGKTETFLIPLVNALLREREMGTLVQPGVRALLLYPMNALANDQMKRLRDLLKGVSDITFGRYIGETEHQRAPALERFRKQFPETEPLDNELLSREEMQQRPPHILLTNYAMLEYLLLRPTDSALFDGPTGLHWHFIVLDEAHTYDGATGIEVAMLLRRLRDRVVNSHRGTLQCIATSATLGRGKEDFPLVAQFATQLFDEPFEWIDGDQARQDVIEANQESIEPLKQADMAIFPPEIYSELRAARDGSNALHALRAVASRRGVPADWITQADATVGSENERSAISIWLATLLSHDRNLFRLRRLLSESGPQDLEAAGEVVFGLNGTEQSNRLVDLVSLAAMARLSDVSRSLLPARYHVFVRAMEGAFVCFANHDGHGPRIYLAAREVCSECDKSGRTQTVFELASCNRCGAEYAVGRLEPTMNGLSASSFRFRSYLPAPGEFPTFLLLNREHSRLDEDDEVEAESADRDSPSTADGEAALLCTVCGTLTIGGDGELSCSHVDDRNAGLKVILVNRAAAGTLGLRACISCGARARRDIVSRFLTGQDAPVSVLATHLYEMIPPARQSILRQKPGEGRKLLVFADSRQDAAFFAPYLNRNHQQLLRRRLIVKVLSERFGLEPRLHDLARWLLPEAEKAGVFDPTQSSIERERIVLSWIMAEFAGWDRRNSIEGTGLAAFRPIAAAKPSGAEPPVPPPLLDTPWNLTRDEAVGLLSMLLNIVRQSGVTTYPDGVLATDEIFEPRNRELFIRESGSARQILSWLPMAQTNRRIDLLIRLLERKAAHLSNDERKHLAVTGLQGIWNFLTKSSVWKDQFETEVRANEGSLYRLDYRMWTVSAHSGDGLQGTWYRCDRCGTISAHSVCGVCPTLGCRGSLRVVTPEAPEIRENNYRAVYTTLAPYSMRAEEHTAQWNGERAAEIQQQFMAGELNVLSCSTTFELGVDVGELQAVLLRNVPPTTANYIQRAGRAGRRTDSTAFVVTYAQRRPHDLTFHRDPQKIVAGKVVPPTVSIDNRKIVRRHMHSVALAAFFRNAVERNELRFPVDVGGFFRPEQEEEVQGPVLLADYLAERPTGLASALGRIVPISLHAVLGVLDWKWTGSFVGSGDGVLDRAAELLIQDVNLLNELAQTALSEKRGAVHDRFQMIKTTILRRDLLGFLGNHNVLPKYSFPTDVVELRTSHIPMPTARQVTLTRDLRLALSDYAPGSQVVAGGYLWESRGVLRHYKRAWDTWHYAVCANCLSFLRSRVEVPSVCTVCHQPIDRPLNGMSGTFIVPEFGFVADLATLRRIGETRPPRTYSSRVFFTHGRQEASDPTNLAVDEDEGFEVRSERGVIARYSRQGVLSVVNAGPQGRGFRVCESCGHAESAPLTRERRKVGQSRPKHTNPRTGRECTGFLSHYHLGYSFESDVLALEFPRGMFDRSTALSVLYAVIEGASRALSIQRDDLDGTLYGLGQTNPTLILFDDVPGGAGHVRRVASRIEDVLDEAFKIIKTCSCGEETSCYECLRSYRNQYFHQDLSRGAARKVLMGVCRED